jgi:hypothetical protein
MRAFLASFWAALVLCSTAALAQSETPNLCDGTKIGECRTLAMHYRKPLYPFPQDQDRADRLIGIALTEGKSTCRAGDFPECFNWVNLVQQQAGTDASVRPEQATILLLQTTGQACDEGDPAGCYWQAQGLRKMGDARPAKPTEQELLTKAETLARTEGQSLRPACAAGDAQACGRLGALIHAYDLPEDTPYEHLDLLTQGCLAGADNACLSLGMAAGSLDPKNPAEASSRSRVIDRLETQCGAGHGQICRLLANRILRLSSLDDFLAYATKACDGDDALGCSAIGMTRLEQYRRSQDAALLAKATAALTKACDLDATLACHALEHIGPE